MRRRAPAMCPLSRSPGSGDEFQQRERKGMQVMNERPDENALTIDRSASVLGLHEFSLLSRIQAGEIKSARARSGEIAIPREELERLAGAPINASDGSSEQRT